MQLLCQYAILVCLVSRSCFTIRELHTIPHVKNGELPYGVALTIAIVVYGLLGSLYWGAGALPF